MLKKMCVNGFAGLLLGTILMVVMLGASRVQGLALASQESDIVLLQDYPQENDSIRYAGELDSIEIQGFPVDDAIEPTV